jgi:hypothetical protein
LKERERKVMVVMMIVEDKDESMRTVSTAMSVALARRER